jgi:hypothetical protein
MKLIRADMRLDFSGKPELHIELEPETALEQDALKAMEYKRCEHCEDSTKDILIGTTQPEKATDRMHIFLTYQVSQEKYHQRKARGSNEKV